MTFRVKDSDLYSLSRDRMNLNAKDGYMFLKVSVGGYDYGAGGVPKFMHYTPDEYPILFHSNNSVFDFWEMEKIYKRKYPNFSGTKDVSADMGESVSSVEYQITAIDGAVSSNIEVPISIPSDKEVVLSTPEGFIFEDVRILVWDWGSGGISYSHTFGIEDLDSDLYYNEDKSVFTVTMEMFIELIGQTITESNDVSFTVNTMEQEVPNIDYPDYSTRVTNIYNITSDNLMRFNVKRWTDDLSFDHLIYDIFSIPFKLTGDHMEVNSIPVKAGNVNLGFNAIPFKDNKIIIDGGEIEVPNKYGNVFDYANTSTILHIPFSEPIDIDLDYSIGHVLNIFYSVDLLNGLSYVYVKSSAIDTIIGKEQIELTRKIPYFKPNYVVSNDDITRYIYNEVWTPYIEVKRSCPLLDTNSISGRVERLVGRIGEFSGHVLVDEVRLESKAMLVEKDEIITRLRQGVYIK